MRGQLGVEMTISPGISGMIMAGWLVYARVAISYAKELR